MVEIKNYTKLKLTSQEAVDWLDELSKSKITIDCNLELSFCTEIVEMIRTRLSHFLINQYKILSKCLLHLSFLGA